MIMGEVPSFDDSDPGFAFIVESKDELVGR